MTVCKNSFFLCYLEGNTGLRLRRLLEADPEVIHLIAGEGLLRKSRSFSQLHARIRIGADDTILLLFRFGPLQLYRHSCAPQEGLSSLATGSH